MSSDFTGTNTEKVDKLISTVVELRTAVRLCFAAAALGVPLVVGLLSFLVVQSFSTSAKVDRLADQIAAARADSQSLVGRVSLIEQKIPRP